MKKSLYANIGSVAFMIDEDAYEELSKYLNDIRSRIKEENPQEVIDDIERRIADLFSEELTSRNQVVTIEMVRRVKATIGSPEYFGEKRGFERTEEAYEPKKLFRSRSSNIIAGVCGGLAEYFNIDVTIVRLLTFFLIFFGGMSLWIYIILWIIIPLKR